MLDILPLPGNRVAFCMLLALVVGGVVARILSPFTKRIGLADPPGGRKQHSGTIPVTGGIGMFAGVFFAAMASGLISGATVALVVALFLLVLPRVVDDMPDISHQFKFMIPPVPTLLMTSWAGVQVHVLCN